MGTGNEASRWRSRSIAESSRTLVCLRQASIWAAVFFRWGFWLRLSMPVTLTSRYGIDNGLRLTKVRTMTAVPLPVVECECGEIECRLMLDSGRCAALVAAEAYDGQQDVTGTFRAHYRAVMTFEDIAVHLGLNSHQHAEQIFNRALAQFVRRAREMGMDALVEQVAPWLERIERNMRASR